MNKPGLRAAGRAFWIGLALSLALHALFLARGSFPMAWLQSPPLEARLEAVEFQAVPPPAPQPPPSAPKPAAQLRARPVPAPPPPEAPPPEAASEVAAVPALPLPETPQPEADTAPAAAELPQPAAEAAPPGARPHSALTAAAENIRQLPARIEIVFELKGLLSGRQTHVWQHDGERYTLQADSEATGLTGLFVRGRLVQTSRGRLGPLGLMPEQYEIRRPNGKKETLGFDYDSNLIESRRSDAKRGTRSLQLPLLTGAQDPLSSIYQLAMAAQAGKDGLIVAAASKRIKGYPFRMLGAETLHTPLGEMKTLHVARAGESEKGGMQLWLAPELHALPIKVSYVDEDGSEWVLEAVSVKTR